MNLKGGDVESPSYENTYEKTAKWKGFDLKTKQTTAHPIEQQTNKSIRDTEEIVKAWATDLKFDANDATWDAAKLYVSGTSIQHISGYVAATKEVLDEALVICKKAINNQLLSLIHI